MNELIVIIGLLVVVIPVLAIIIILLLANLGAFFTKIAQGTTAFISAGDSLKAILPNVGGYRMSDEEDLDGRHWLIPEEDEEKRTEKLFHNSLYGTEWFQRWLWKAFGVRFISLFWPHVDIHRFDIRKGGRRRIEARAEVGQDAPLRSRVVDSPEPTVVDSLLFLVPRPVYLEGVELAGDNSRVNLLLLPVYRQVIPSLPVYYLKGDFFTLLDAAIKAAMVDFFASHRIEDGSPLTYSNWLKLTKAGEGSPLEQRLRHLNVSDEYIGKLEKQGKDELADYVKNHLIPRGPSVTPSRDLAGMIPSGIVPRFGFALVSFRVVEWEAHSSTVALANSLLARETELHTAEGVRQKAYGERDAKVANATGDSSLVTQVMTAFKAHGVDANVAAGVLGTMVRTKNIGDSNLTTYVEGGGTAASVMIPASPPSTPTE